MQTDINRIPIVSLAPFLTCLRLHCYKLNLAYGSWRQELFYSSKAIKESFSSHEKNIMKLFVAWSKFKGKINSLTFNTHITQFTFSL